MALFERAVQSPIYRMGIKPRVPDLQMRAGSVGSRRRPLDWDGEAWDEDRRTLGFDRDADGNPTSSWDCYWPIYQAALVAETRRLCKESR